MPRDQESDPGHAAGVRDRAYRLRRRIASLVFDALQFVPANRPAELVRQWVNRTVSAERDQPARLGDALGFAMDMALFTPSASGSTAIDRLARHRTPADEDEAAALAALRRARFCLLRIEGQEASGAWRVCDLASGDSLLLYEEHFAAGIDGIAMVARLCPLDGVHVATGPVLPLDEAGVGVASGFIRPDRHDLVNPLRCAEAVYRHVLRHGGPEIRGMNRPPEDPPGPADERPLDALARAWAEAPPDAEPDPDDEQAVRELTGIDALLDALADAVFARQEGQDRLANAYARIAGIQIETIARRSAVGVLGGRFSLDTVAAAIDRAVADGMPSAARRLFDTLAATMRPAAPAGSGRDTDLDRLVQRIQGLRAKTVAQGCTEAEAMAAAEKVAELLDRHGLSLSEVELRRQTCESVGIETGRRRTGPIDECVPTVAAFFDCRTWGETTPAGTIRHLFFGLPGDVAAAHYLYDLVDAAFETETVRFQSGDIYRALAGGDRRSATNSFRLGLARGICGKLHDLRAAREQTMRGSSGRDLVPVKASVVDDELAKLGLSFRSRARRTGRRVLVDAYEAGQEAGAGFDYRPALAGHAPA